MKPLLGLLACMCLLSQSAGALTRSLHFKIGGQTYYGFLFSQQRTPDEMPPITPQNIAHLGSVSWTPNIRAETTYEDYSFGALERLLFEGNPFFAQSQNVELLHKNSDVNIAHLRDVLATTQNSTPTDIAQVNQQIEKLIKQLIEQWVIEQYKKTRSYIPPEFFDELRKKEPLDREGATTLALFDAQKRLVATLGMVIRTPNWPLLDLESRLGIQVPPFQPYETVGYPILHNGMIRIPGLITVARDAELKKFVVDPSYNRTIIPAMLYFLDNSGFLAFGQSVHPNAYRLERVSAIGRYYLEADTVGMRIYRSRRYGFETVSYDQTSDTYVMMSDREQLLNIWKNFAPTDTNFQDLLGPFQMDSQYPPPSYSDGRQRIDRTLRAKAIQRVAHDIEMLNCRLALSSSAQHPY